MALLEKQLFVKRSSIPGAGKGLFTKKLIPKGTRIIEYKGRKTAWKDVNQAEGNNGYIYYINRNHVIDAMNRKSSLARYANDARGLTKIKGINNNCEYISEGHRAFIESIREIPAGGEILVPYGAEYWQVIRTNIRIDKKEAAEKKAAKKSTKKAAKKPLKKKHTVSKKTSNPKKLKKAKKS